MVVRRAARTDFQSWCLAHATRRVFEFLAVGHGLSRHRKRGGISGNKQGSKERSGAVRVPLKKLLSYSCSYIGQDRIRLHIDRQVPIGIDSQLQLQKNLTEFSVAYEITS